MTPPYLLPAVPAPSFASHHVVEAGDLERPAVEAFVARAYRENFDARLRHFFPHILAWYDDDAALRACVGFRCAAHGPLFLESYLDQPIERYIDHRRDPGVKRDDIFEIGGFAATRAGDTRSMVALMTFLLAGAGVRWVVFSATQQLRNAVARLGLAPEIIAHADPSRVPTDGTYWGSYYESHPQLVLGNVGAGKSFLLEAGMPNTVAHMRLAQPCELPA